MAFEFSVIDNRTGKYPDCETIALTEEWAKHLIYCDIDCFAITEYGQLVLVDDCNNIAYPPADRFTVAIDPESLRPQGEWIHDYNNLYGCSNCMERETMSHKHMKPYCPNCGAKMKGE